MTPSKKDHLLQKTAKQISQRFTDISDLRDYIKKVQILSTHGLNKDRKWKLKLLAIECQHILIDRLHQPKEELITKVKLRKSKPRL